MAKKLPTCDVCKYPVTWKIDFQDHTAGKRRVASLCGTHARPFRTRKRCAEWTVKAVIKVEYKGF